MTIKTPFNLEERSLLFAREVRTFLKKAPKTMANMVDGKQLLRSSGSVGANYIEANEGLGKDDFKYHIKIARKEAKESMHWLSLIDASQEQAHQKALLIDESRQLIFIFTAILKKVS